MLQHSLLIKH